MGKIVVNLPKDRSRYGQLIVTDDRDSTVLGPVRCLGKADNQTAAKKGNPSRNPEMPFGDAPTGEYDISFAASSTKDTDTFGIHPVIYMTERSGSALRAARNGRSGLLIHGGRTRASSNGDIDLRPTYGCIRVDDDTMESLHELHAKERITRLEVYEV